MEQLYSNTADWPLKFEPTSIEMLFIVDSNKKQVVKALVRLNKEIEKRAYYIVKDGNDYKIDWEPSVGANEPSLKAFQVERKRLNRTFRLIGELSDYYNFDFSDRKESMYSIDLIETGTGNRIHGYVLKNTDAGKDLFKLLKDGGKVKVLVELACPSRFQDSSVTEIVQFLSSEWLY